MEAIKIDLPLSYDKVRSLKAGDCVLLSGKIYTGRDAAHKRLIELIDAGKELPIEIENQTIYYVGPAPAKPNEPVGSCGPTTSYRMDPYTPKLIELGLKGMIGKGKRSQEVIDKMKECGAVYFGATGGAAALIAKSVKSAEVVCYEDLGAEAIHVFEIENFPAIVIIDSYGNNLYESGPKLYKTAEL